MPMPTPFYHLNLAQDLLAHPACPPLLADHSGPFFLGNIAPDAQNISGQTREATHFFSVPMRDPAPAWHGMFDRHPVLARPAALPPARAAFNAGYICHLALDQMWIAEIFDPVFGEAAPWGVFRERLFLHNILRIYLDQRDYPALRPALGDTLGAARPDSWLPFLTDAAIAAWGTYVASQLAHGADAQTIEVFARRMGLHRADFESLLQSPHAMQTRIFSRISEHALADFRQRGLAHSLNVIASYLPG
ncbi:MAG: hypothetical protein HYY33_07075 [Chloroflexi bacterium]|nr:hypothetical protein [Chloroflexota bacterium]